MYELMYTDDAEFAKECHEAFIRGQQALDRLLWNETARYYNAYIVKGDQENSLNSSTIWDTADKNSKRAGMDVQEVANVTYEANRPRPSPPGAIMTDTFYSQVCSNIYATVDPHLSEPH